MVVVFSLLYALWIWQAVGYDNGAPGSKFPTLGWASWVSLGPKDEHPIFDYCDEFSVKAAADAYVELGLKDIGYTSFHLDDCWANKDRNSSGFLLGETDHFPNGMKPIADYVHSKGLNFGLYTCAGSHTCVGGRPGSKDHWTQDANVFAEWGVDWVKMDNCNTKGMGKPEDYYPKMSQALNATGRAIHFNMCEWGDDDPWKWGEGIAQSWRMHGDHIGRWTSTKEVIKASSKIEAKYTGRAYGWNDMDMLQTGNYDQAAHANNKESNMTATEYRTEFSMWAINASPLVVTTPIMNCTKTPPKKYSPNPKSTDCKILKKREASHSKCVLGENYGCHDGKSTMWAKPSCRGQFIVDGAPVICEDLLGDSGDRFCTSVTCTPWISDLQKEIMLNTDVIGINQDVTPQGRPVIDGDRRLWARNLTGGDIAVAFYNENDDEMEMAVDFAMIGWSSTKHAYVRDLWEHKNLGMYQGRFPGKGSTIKVAPHETKVYRLNPHTGSHVLQRDI